MAKILIIEDSPSQAAIIQSIVKDSGHEPVLFQDFTKSVSQSIRQIAPDIVLLDLVLLGSDGKPVADGFQICREIKRVSQNKIGVVILSAKSDADSAEWAVLQGADAFLQKPFVVQDLLGVISDLLNKGKLTS